MYAIFLFVIKTNFMVSFAIVKVNALNMFRNRLRRIVVIKKKQAVRCTNIPNRISGKRFKSNFHRIPKIPFFHAMVLVGCRVVFRVVCHNWNFSALATTITAVGKHALLSAVRGPL